MLREVGKIVYGALLSPTAKAIQRDRLTFLSAEKLFSLERECRRVERAGIGGDFVEFGVALGGSAIVLAKRMGPARRFHGFDVFGMIPPPTSEKTTRSLVGVMKSSNQVEPKVPAASCTTATGKSPGRGQEPSCDL